MKNETKNTYEARINKTLDYIQKHLHDDISLDVLAKVSFFSPYHFHRIFSGMVGETLGEYIRRLRLERAAIDISQTSRKITDIAFDAGYETVESFGRAFSSKFKVTPNAYRKQRIKTNSEKFKRFNKNINIGDSIMEEVKIIQQQALKVAYVRNIGPYITCEKAWNTLCSWACPKGLFSPSTKILGLCYDDPDVTPADKIRYDACITIEEDIKTEGEIKIQEIPEGEYACVTHTGPYTELKDIYIQLCGKWLPASGREMKHAPSMEIYLNDPKSTPPKDLKTQILLPLK